MKLRTTTPASKTFFMRFALISLSILAFIAVPMQMTQKVSADQYDDKIRALQQDIARYQAEGERLNGEAATLQSALGQLANQKAAIQTQIDINQVKHDQLVAQITETEIKIKSNQNALGDIIAKIYIDDKITPLEMLASSSNISEYLDKQAYRSSVRNELTSKIGEIKDLKAKLVTQKADITKILNEQKAQRDDLAVKESEQSSLLSKTQGQEAGYQQLISKSQADIAEAKATQALLNSRFNSGGGYTLIGSGSLGAYPWNDSNCRMSGYLSTGGSNGNGGDGYGYGCRQCASYVAWKIATVTGRYYSWGNAVNFTSNAIAAGYHAGPARAGSIAVMDPGKAGQSYGHVAWVEAASGGMVTISQYNYNYGAGYGMYSMMVLPESAFDHYVQIQ